MEHKQASGETRTGWDRKEKQKAGKTKRKNTQPD